MHSDYLFIVAEIGAAFAGFSSLMAAFSKGGDRTREQEEFAFRTLRNVLLLSLLAVASALMPILLERVGLSVETAWRSASFVYAGGVGYYVAFTVGRLTAAYRSLGRTPPPTWYLNAGLISTTVWIQTLCVFDLVPLRLYLLGPSTLLGAAATGFVRLFHSLRPAGSHHE